MDRFAAEMPPGRTPHVLAAVLRPGQCSIATNATVSTLAAISTASTMHTILTNFLFIHVFPQFSEIPNSAIASRL